MAIVQANPAHGRLARRFTHVSWPLLRWSAAAGGIGGLAGWAIGEPFVGPNLEPLLALYLHNLLYFGILGGAIGALLGALPGILNRSWRQALRGARGGLLVAGLGGAIGSVPAQFMFNMLGDGLVARAVGWAILGGFVGLCPGFATRDRRRAMRGVLGGLMGGFAGGLLFNLVGYLTPAGSATASRFIADLVVGLCVGLLVAVVESVSKTAWLTALSGRREGAQFILSKDITLIGRDDRDDVILWGDPLLATRHARIERGKGGYVLESLAVEAPTMVNGQPIRGTAPLRDGDEVMLGGTRLVFHTRGAPPSPPAPTAPHRRVPAPASAVQGVRSAPNPTGFAPPPAPSAVAAAVPPPTSAALAGLQLVELAPVGRTYSLTPGTTMTFGRRQDNTVVLDDATVSGRHAELREENGRWVVRDLGSTNGTYVSYGGTGDSERRVVQNAIKEGSILRIGEARFRLDRNESQHS